jgi:uncharacterized membrane protein YqiK
MDPGTARAPAWFLIVVAAAIVVGIALAFWFYAVVTAVPAAPG